MPESKAEAKSESEPNAEAKPWYAVAPETTIEFSKSMAPELTLEMVWKEMKAGNASHQAKKAKQKARLKALEKRIESLEKELCLMNKAQLWATFWKRGFMGLYGKLRSIPGYNYHWEGAMTPAQLPNSET